jgi:hypothetical protein
MGQTRFCEQAARGQIVVLMNQNAPGKHAQRSVHNAHVIVEHEVMDIGAVQQRTSSRKAAVSRGWNGPW